MVEIASSKISKRNFYYTFTFFHEIRSKLGMLFYCYLVNGLGKILAKNLYFRDIQKESSTSSLASSVRPFYQEWI